MKALAASVDMEHCFKLRISSDLGCPIWTQLL